jgi:uncharacterized protein
VVPVEILAVIALVGIAALIQSMTGFGFALLIVPPLVLLLGPREAVVLSNVIGTVIAAVMLLRLHREVQWKTTAVLIGASVFGLPLGLLALTQLDPDVLQVFIAITVIVFTVLLMRGFALGSRITLQGSLAAGVIAGVLRTSTSMSGPPVVLYLQGTRMPSGAFRSTMTGFALLSGLTGVAVFLVEGSLTARLGLTGLAATPAVLAGLYVGARLYDRVGEARFRGVVFAVLIASALLAIAGAISP